MAKKSLMAEIAAMINGADLDIELETTYDTRNYRTADAPVVFAHHPPTFRPGFCRECGRPFATNRSAVGFCSDPCRQENWVKTMHIPWESVSIKDPWYGDPPIILRPDQFEKLEAIAEWFTENRTRLETARQQWLDENPPEVPVEEEESDHPSVWDDFPSNPLDEPDLSILPQTTKVDDPFGF